MADLMKAGIGEGEYRDILQQAVSLINSGRQHAARQLCAALTTSYWNIGKLLYERKLDSQYGSGVVKRLSADLKAQYPKMGLSPRNLWDMRTFYIRYRDSGQKVRQAVALLPWGHILLLLRHNCDDEVTLYYADETIRKGWSRDLLLNALKMEMHTRKDLIAHSDNNFSKALSASQAAYADDVFRSSYNLGFLGVTEPILELELERRLVEKIKQFLLELGRGFAFIGNQHELEYNGKISRVDLLLFHRGLRCLVAIDLKIGEFRPEYAGKMNYYLSLLDRMERGEGENRSIGIILCAEKDHVEVELALEDMGKPIGVADYGLIVPKEEIKRVILDEMKDFGESRKADNAAKEE